MKCVPSWPFFSSQGCRLVVSCLTLSGWNNNCAISSRCTDKTVRAFIVNKGKSGGKCHPVLCFGVEEVCESVCLGRLYGHIVIVSGCGKSVSVLPHVRESILSYYGSAPTPVCPTNAERLHHLTFSGDFAWMSYFSPTTCIVPQACYLKAMMAVDGGKSTAANRRLAHARKHLDRAPASAMYQPLHLHHMRWVY